MSIRIVIITLILFCIGIMLIISGIKTLLAEAKLKKEYRKQLKEIDEKRALYAAVAETESDPVECAYWLAKLWSEDEKRHQIIMRCQELSFSDEQIEMMGGGVND